MYVHPSTTSLLRLRLGEIENNLISETRADPKPGGADAADDGEGGQAHGRKAYY